MSGRDVVRVTGPDARVFLQGQLSQDVDAVPVGGTAPSFLLSPQGRVDAWLEIRRPAPNVFELVVDGGWGERVEARLRRFLLRTSAELERAAEERDGVDSDLDRIEAGIPAMGAEIDERTIPAETGLVDASVSFTKGCFVGQELVARMDSRTAEPPRRLVRIRIDAPPDAFARGARIEVAGVVAGEVTSVAWSEAAGAAKALGYVRRGTALGALAEVAGYPATLEGRVGA